MAKGGKYDGGERKTGDYSILDVKELGIESIRYSKEGTYALDFMPYKITSKGHPRVVAGDSDVGDEEYAMWLDVHRSVGVKKHNIICPENFEKPCPICNHLKEVNATYGYKSKEGDAAYKKCGKAVRALYFVVDPDDKDQKIKLFETSWKNFHKELIDEARAEGKRMGLNCVPFTDFPMGCTVEFRVTMEKMPGGADYPKFKAFKFIKRKGNEYPEDFLKDLPGMDELMITRTYEEIDALFQGADSDDDEGEAEPRETRTRSRDTEEDTPRSGRETVEEEAPRTRRASRDEEDEPTPKKDEKPKCPEKGGTFGVDIDDLDDGVCDKCALRSACSAEYKASRRRGA